MARTTAVVSAQRVNQIYKLVLQGEPRAKILDFCVHNWGIKSTQAKAYLAKARKRMVEDLDLERNTLRGHAIAQRNDLYRRAYKESKYFTCLQILDSRDRILGLFDDINTHIEILEADGYEVRDPSLDPENQDPAGELFADLECIPESEVESTPPGTEDGLVPGDTEAVPPPE